MLKKIRALESGQIRTVVSQSKSWMGETLETAYDGQSFDDLKTPMLADLYALPAMRAHLTTLENAYLIFLPGLDGAVITKDGDLIAETAHFSTDLQRIDALDKLIPQAIDLDMSLFTSVDVAWCNYYHWLCFGIGRCGLVNDFLADHFSFAFPVYDAHENPSYKPLYTEDVWRNSLAMLRKKRPLRLLKEGIYRVRELSLIWTDDEGPTALTTLRAFYRFFSKVSESRSSCLEKKTLIVRKTNQRLTAQHQQLVIDASIEYGFNPVCLEDLSFLEQVDLFSNSSKVIAAHGAGLANILFSPPGISVLEFNLHLDGVEIGLRPWFYLITDGLRGRYRYVNTSPEDFGRAQIYESISRFALT